jgi:hypothetical protein
MAARFKNLPPEMRDWYFQFNWNLDNPEKHPRHDKRIDAADISYPLKMNLPDARDSLECQGAMKRIPDEVDRRDGLQAVSRRCRLGFSPAWPATEERLQHDGRYVRNGHGFQGLL